MAAVGSTPIKLYGTNTASQTPLAANLANDSGGIELAVNGLDGKLFYKDNSGNVQVLASKATGSIGGSTTQVQFNNSGALGGSASLTWSGTVLTSSGFAGPLNGTVGATTANTGAFTTLTAATSITNSSLTTGRIVYTTTGGLETSSANLLYSGTDLTVYGLTVGRGAGAVSTNTAVGASALAANTSGTGNLALGYNALNAATADSSNTALGFRALLLQNGGSSNTAVGSDALHTSTTGIGNIAMGSDAMYYTTTGSYNVGIGQQALRSNTTASNNTAVGYQAGYSANGANAVSIGYQAGYQNLTGNYSVSVGYQALYGGASADIDRAVAIGAFALKSDTTGDYNVAVGYEALQANTTASSNTAVGYQAGYTNQTGGYNVFIGHQSGYLSNYNGNSYNVCVGWASGYSLTTGTNNTFVGGGNGAQAAGGAITTGSKNTIIGTYNGNQGGLNITTLNNYIVLSDGDGNPRQIIDSSGNLGLGVTPSAWGTLKGFDISTFTASYGYTNQGGIAFNSYYDGSGWKYKQGSVAAGRYGFDTGTHYWNIAGSGSAGGTITFTQAMTLDASGNLGIGTSSPTRNLVVSGGASEGVFQVTNTTSGVGATDGFQLLHFTNGESQIINRENGPILIYTNNTERMRIDSSGNLLVGGTSAVDSSRAQIYGAKTLSSGIPQQQLNIADTSAIAAGAGGAIAFSALYSGSSYTTMGSVEGVRENATNGNYAGALVFKTRTSFGNNDERMRITSSGSLLVGCTGGGSSGNAIISYGSGGDIQRIWSTQASSPSYSLISMFSDATNPASPTGTLRVNITTNGGIANYQANDTNLSDRREKTNFSPSKSYLDVICAIPVQTFNYIDQNLEEDAGLTLGVVAQDVQAVAPELVMESNWGTEEDPKMRLSIYQTDLQYALMKALQELKAEFDAYKASHP
jgi:hypothetical protein